MNIRVLGKQFDGERRDRTSEELREKPIIKALKEAGIDRRELTSQMMDRLRQLHELTPTFEDEIQAAQYAQMINERLRQTAPERALTDLELDAVFGGTFFSDIGKTGPADATAEQSMVVTRMYSIDARFNPSGTAREFIERFLPGEAQQLIADLNSIDGLSEDMAMREFWNAHVYWSYDLIKDSNLPGASKRAAASHHVLEGNFPPEVIEETGRITGTDTYIGAPEVWVMMLDKYDAQRRRAGATHHEAIEWLRKLEERDTWQKLDPRVQDIMHLTIDDIDQTFGQEESPAIAAK